MTAGRRRLVSAVLFFCLAVKMFCAGNTEQDAAAEPVPYREEEFPGWMQDLRRAEIIAFGSFPFVVFFSTMYYDVYRYFSHGCSSSYLPWPFKDSSTAAAVTNDELKMLVAVSAGISAGVAAVDWIFRTVAHSRQEKREAEEAGNGNLPIQIRPRIRANPASHYPQPPLPVPPEDPQAENP